MLEALIISWLVVTKDCKGGPENYVHYQVSRLVGRCVGEETDTPICTTDLTVVDTEGLSVVLLDIPEPIVGEIQWLDVRAVDAVGNKSDGGACE